MTLILASSYQRGFPVYFIVASGVTEKNSTNTSTFIKVNINVSNEVAGGLTKPIQCLIFNVYGERNLVCVDWNIIIEYSIV